MKTIVNIIKTGQVTETAKIRREWHLVDAGSENLGRVATKIASLLRGRGKTDWSPMQDVGDHVVVINSTKVKLSGNKANSKTYYRHSSYPGHLKETSFEELLAKRPNEVVRRAVYGMLAKNKFRGMVIKRLHVFADEKHTFKNRLNKQV